MSEAIRLTGTTGDSYVEVGENNNGIHYENDPQNDQTDMTQSWSLSIAYPNSATFHIPTQETDILKTLQACASRAVATLSATSFLMAAMIMADAFQCDDLLGKHLSDKTTQNKFLGDVYLSDSSWVEAMQEELLQFKLQQVWILVDLLNERKPLEQNGSSETRKIKWEL
ncbi:hypothetical protein Tco_0074252 [Tanacetum coccineum]